MWRWKQCKRRRHIEAPAAGSCQVLDPATGEFVDLPAPERVICFAEAHGQAAHADALARERQAAADAAALQASAGAAALQPQQDGRQPPAAQEGLELDLPDPDIPLDSDSDDEDSWFSTALSNSRSGGGGSSQTEAAESVCQQQEQAVWQAFDASCCDARLHPIIRVSSDRTEADFLIGHRSGRQRKRRWTVVGYRWVRFSDRKLLVGWCKGGCCTDGNRLFDLLEGIDRRAQLHTWLQPPAQCECSRRLLAKLGGAELLTELQAAAGGTTLHDGDGALISEVYLPVGGRFLAVRPAGGGFDSWGVLDAKGRCCTCNGNNWHCAHAEALQSQPDTAAAQSATDAKRDSWERKLSHAVDYATGKPPLRCISRRKLPQDLRDSGAEHLLCHQHGCALQKRSSFPWQVP